MSDTAPIIKLVLSDMDGTILGPDKRLSPATCKAVEQLAAHHVPVALVSARLPAAILPYVRQLGLKGPCAGFNGGVFFSPDGTILKSYRFPPEDVTALLARLAPLPVELWFQTEREWLVRDASTALVQREHNLTGITPREVAELSLQDEAVNRVMVCSEDTALIARLEAELPASFGGRASMLRSAPHKLNITPALANKGDAVRELAQLYGVTPQNVAVLGDAPNDLPMLSVAGMSIAMGQAPEGVKAQARYVTKTPAEDGWAYAAERFIIPAALSQ
ncbi:MULTISPECIES: Cof-type HAD-IIB family hydrolase [unclassified Bombella]|uniref:Cof-type HAD-IIB family hydrolase n=1 Tax=unclassified Bombella TaxID=2644098 RepID=UPI001E463CB0|nr:MULTISPECIES: Cof-type HAD-IIB family hydrolase [unclassified Bombella]